MKESESSARLRVDTPLNTVVGHNVDYSSSRGQLHEFRRPCALMIRVAKHHTIHSPENFLKVKVELRERLQSSLKVC